jgi:hypothetical protein
MVEQDWLSERFAEQRTSPPGRKITSIAIDTDPDHLRDLDIVYLSISDKERR